MNHVVMYSGGIGSWAAAKRVAAQHGTDNLTLLFTDTKGEDPDTYRFLRESAANVGGKLVVAADGRTIWQVFKDVRFLGNNRVAPCSRVLKMEVAHRWVEENYPDPATVQLYLGYDWTEPHRFEPSVQGWLPWRVSFPMGDEPYLTKNQLHDWCSSEGIEKQILYKLGASHANCGGGCVRMGMGGWARLLRASPERYAEWERNEQEMRDYLKGDVAILRDRSGGVTRPLTLTALRERMESGESCDLFDIGGCGCFVDEPVVSETGEPMKDQAPR